jgi:bifunctional non-homologous end joining protein LigD
LSAKFRPVAESLRGLNFDAVLDGEIVVLDDKGQPDFEALQNYQKSGRGHLFYYVFDLPYFKGHDLTDLPLIRRKDILKKILPSLPGIRFSDHIWKEGILFFNVAKGKGIEGIMAKHSQSAYRMGVRSAQWLKIKIRITQEAVVAGFTKPKGSRKFFGSLALGVYEGKELVYIGQSGGGFGARLLGEISEKLKPLVQEECPFNIAPETNTPVTWVKPVLVCEIAFHGWTAEGLMRQPVFLRMREDKTAREAVRGVDIKKVPDRIRTG